MSGGENCLLAASDRGTDVSRDRKEIGNVKIPGFLYNEIRICDIFPGPCNPVKQQGGLQRRIAGPE